LQFLRPQLSEKICVNPGCFLTGRKLQKRGHLSDVALLPATSDWPSRPSTALWWRRRDGARARRDTDSLASPESIAMGRCNRCVISEPAWSVPPTNRHCSALSQRHRVFNSSANSLHASIQNWNGGNRRLTGNDIRRQQVAEPNRERALAVTEPRADGGRVCLCPRVWSTLQQQIAPCAIS